jgi:hypothetical protein
MLERNSFYDDPGCLESGDGEGDESEDCQIAKITIHVHPDGKQTLVMADRHIDVTSRELEMLVRNILLTRVLFVCIKRIAE